MPQDDQRLLDVSGIKQEDLCDDGYGDGDSSQPGKEYREALHIHTQKRRERERPSHTW